MNKTLKADPLPVFIELLNRSAPNKTLKKGKNHQKSIKKQKQARNYATIKNCNKVICKKHKKRPELSLATI